MLADIRNNMNLNCKLSIYAICIIIFIYPLYGCSNGWLRKNDPDIMAWMNSKKSSLAREKDWLDCGGNMNGYIQDDNKNKVMSCMKTKGYNFIGSCKDKYDNFCRN